MRKKLCNDFGIYKVATACAYLAATHLSAASDGAMAAAEAGMEEGEEEAVVSPITMARGYCKTLPHSTDSTQHFYRPLASTSHIFT